MAACPHEKQPRETDAIRPIPADAVEIIVGEHVGGLITPTRNGNAIRGHLRELIKRVDVGAERWRLLSIATILTTNQNQGHEIATTLRKRLRARNTLEEPDDKLVLIIPAQSPDAEVSGVSKGGKIQTGPP